MAAIFLIFLDKIGLVAAQWALPIATVASVAIIARFTQPRRTLAQAGTIRGTTSTGKKFAPLHWGWVFMNVAIVNGVLAIMTHYWGPPVTPGRLLAWILVSSILIGAAMWAVYGIQKLP